MRISDWSSDVCSSDLTRTYRQAAIALTARPINMEYRLDKQVRHPLHIQAVLHPCPLSAVSFPMMIPATHCAPSIPRSLHEGVNRPGMRRAVWQTRWRELGRGACRESVCEYG